VRLLSAVIAFAFRDRAREARRVSKPLRRELTGLYSARRGLVPPAVPDRRGSLTGAD
jgi:hypothetical protein